MPGLGEYRDRVRVLTRSLAAADGLGERVESWPDPGESGDYWAKVEAPSGGEDPLTPRQATASLNVRFRGIVVVTAVDRLKLFGTDVYAIVGAWKERAEHGGWQTVCSLSGVY